MSEDLRGKAVFVTGASSGIGRAVALHLLEQGCRVWGTARAARRLEDLPGLHPLELDFARPETIDAAWNEAVRASGGIEVVVQNAGAGWFGPLEETGDEAASTQWQVLVGGPARLLRLAAGHLRARRGGKIIGIGSIAGELPMPYFSHYSAGKAAFGALMAGWWMELRPFGVQVVDLRPGDIRTEFNHAVRRSPAVSSPYAAEAERAWAEACRLLDAAPGPERVAREVAALIRHPHPPAVRRCGDRFQVMAAALAGLLPRAWVLGLIRRYYRLGGGG